jgi:ATP-dependent Zn protease
MKTLNIDFMSQEQKNPLLAVIGETGPEEFAAIIDRCINALVENQEVFAQDTFQDDYYLMCKLRDALLELKKGETEL